MHLTFFLRNVWRCLSIGLILAVISALFPLNTALATDEQNRYANQADSPEWLEPEGISVIDLVGNVPEAHLKDAIITYSGLGIVQYVAGQRQGDQVTIDVLISPRYFEASIGTVTQFSCLGDRGWVDSWSTIAPASEFRLFYEGADITQNILGINTLPAGKLQPVTGTRGGNRYGQLVYSDPVFLDNGSLLMPAHRDCTVYIAGEYPALSGRYILQTPNFLSTEYLGSQTFDFHTYIGPGDAGDLDSLRRQMSSRFGNRHDKFSLDIPEGDRIRSGQVSAHSRGWIHPRSSGQKHHKTYSRNLPSRQNEWKCALRRSCHDHGLAIGWTVSGRRSVWRQRVSEAVDEHRHVGGARIFRTDKCQL